MDKYQVDQKEKGKYIENAFGHRLVYLGDDCDGQMPNQCNPPLCETEGKHETEPSQRAEIVVGFTAPVSQLRCPCPLLHFESDCISSVFSRICTLLFPFTIPITIALEQLSDVDIDSEPTWNTDMQ